MITNVDLPSSAFAGLLFCEALYFFSLMVRSGSFMSLVLYSTVLFSLVCFACIIFCRLSFVGVFKGSFQVAA